MISAFAVGLATLVPLQAAAAAVEAGSAIVIDPCVDADREEIVRLLEVELQSSSNAGSPSGRRLRIVVSCTDEPDIVRLFDPEEPGRSARLLDLRALGAAARKARARELALVIAEYLRVSRDVPEPRPAQPPRAAPRASQDRVRFELSLLGGAEKYSGGYAQLGMTAGLRLLPISRLVLEARLGARAAPPVRAPAGDVSAAGLVGAIGVGIDLFPTERAAGLVVLARLEGDWLFVSGTSSDAGSAGRDRNGTALVGSIAPSAWLGLGRSWRIALEPALLVPIQQLSIEDRQKSISAISGLGAAASVGLSVTL